MKTNKYITKRSFIVIVVIAIAAIFILKYLSTEYTVESDKLKTVAVSKVIRTDLSQTITLSAEFVPYNEATLYAKVAGYLRKINVDIGDQVKAGDVLAVLDVPELADLLARNKASYEQARLDYTRISGVIKKRPELVAQEEVDQYAAAHSVAKANFEHAKTMYEYSVITAPYDGIITKRFVDEGAMIQEGTSSSTQPIPIVQIADNTRLRLIFPVPESNVSAVKPGSPVDITVSSTGENFKLVVARIARKVATETRTMETQVDVYNPTLKLAPGMYASAKLYLNEKKNVLALPIAAVEIIPKPTVWLINDKKEIEERAVTIGLQTPEMIEILNGLKEGDLVIYGNRNSLTLGMTVKPKLIEMKKL